MTDPKVPSRDGHDANPLVRWRRHAYRAVQGKARATALIGVLPVVVGRETFDTRAGNAWFSVETGMSDWPAAGFVDTEIGCFMKPEVADAAKTIWA
ncbi:hypothetical protein [Bosea sp. R86505]|uniref:hypothetical protein n=1 Tax=Bosea sp. R86505 TaxID=3101710 RepID=UPI0036729459